MMVITNITALRKARKERGFSEQEAREVNEWCLEHGYEPLWADYPLAKRKGL